MPEIIVPEIIIDEEFKSFLPMLDVKTHAMLEASLLEHGCLHPLVLWNDILIDGHNRYELCTKHGIPFKTVALEFSSRENVLIWMITTQVSRRNLTSMQLRYFRGTHYLADKKIQGTKNQFVQESEKFQSETFQGSTAGRLAEQYRVSRSTIIRDADVAKAINVIGEQSPEAKSKILAGEVGIESKVLKGLLALPNDDVVELATTIEEGTYEKRRPEQPEAAGGGNPPLLDAGSVGLQPIQVDILSVTDRFSAELRKYALIGDTVEMKAAIKVYISVLEDLYSQLSE